MTDMDIPQGWHRVPIGDCIVERRKSQIKVDNAAGYGNYPFFTSGEVVLQHTEKQIDGENIFLSTGGNAVVKYYDGQAAYSTDTYVVAGNEHVSTKFLYYALDFLTEYINTNYFQGSGLKHLQKKDFKRHELIIPSSLEEQERIAKALTQIDDAIDSSSRLIAKYEQVKKGLMHDLLTYGIDKDGNIRSELTHQFKDSPIGRIPVEWEVISLQSLVDDGCLIQTGPFGTQLHVTDYTKEGIPVIMPKDIQDNKILNDDLTYISLEKAKVLIKYQLKLGDLLVARKGDVKKIALIDDKTKGSICGSDCIIVRLPKSYYPYFFFNYYQSNGFIKDVVTQSVGTTLPTLKPSILKNIHIPYVSLLEQRQICSYILDVSEIINLEKKEKAKYIYQRSALLSDLMTGKVRI